MKRQRPLLLLLLMVYIFSPTLLSWVIHPDGGWYRPYLIWLLIIVIAYFIQDRKPQQDKVDTP
ncbi:hypothetical protein [Teredinibacter haidensis]|uniref:hypothetical protein n=1 Tax=Teredinibacter haidensis TaxID=2731755 RepID=UPI000948D70C|nr:hypothetical protein [Teredinibacter haidensis]